jgi:MSHA biogenesis protein MshE
MFEDAVQVNASDIHIEPDERELRIRFRLDGVLRVQTTADRRIGGALVSRLKLMAGLDISEKRLPQDGRLNVRVREKSVDVRMSTMPVQYGESVVMRLLNQATGILKLDHVGMPPSMLKRFREQIHAPNGMVLVTGPTGSGKTTTLYAALNELNRPESKILTVEDPVEYRLGGVNQVQVNPKIELSFARVLRSMLRQDPDIILVGEMRDQETAEIGLRAAMTGHFVLSTLHTNDAVSTALRLIDMGVAPYMVAASVRGIVSQRLVRRICDACSAPYELTVPEQAMLQAELGEQAATLKFRRGAGCSHCNGTGYRGRIGVFEYLEMDENLVRALYSSDPIAFSDAAKKQPGYRNLRRSAIAMAAQGHTTIAQVMRATFGLED